MGKAGNLKFRPQGRLHESLLESLEVGVAVADPMGTFVYANARFTEMVSGSSRTHKSLSGRNIRDFVLAEGWSQLADALAAGMTRSVEGEMLVWSGDLGRQKTIHISFGPHFDGEYNAIRIVATEVTALVEAKKALKRSEDTFSAQLLQAQDEERRRMARDLHDVTGQELALAVLTLGNLKREVNGARPSVQQAIEESVELLRKIDGEIRTFSYLLHPPMLDEMGIRSALLWYIEGFCQRTGIAVQTNLAKNLPRFPVDVETAVFRVIQEALTNVFRHSGSKKAWVQLSAKRGRLWATVRDVGQGFDSKAIVSREKGGGLGIQSMRDRLRVFGGEVQFRSSTHGTTVTATVPAKATEPSPAEDLRPVQRKGKEALPASGARKRILVVDDHEVARAGIRTLLKDESDLEICGEARDGVEAVHQVRALSPDLVIMDLSMPNLGGLGATRRLNAAGLQTKVLIYTTHEYPGLQRVAEAVGCDGLVLKSNASHDLIRGVRAVLEGGRFFDDPESAKAHSASAGG